MPDRTDAVHSSAPLLASRRLLPLFIAQTLGAVNDNLFKNAMVVLLAFKAAQHGGGAGGAVGGGVSSCPTCCSPPWLVRWPTAVTRRA